MARGSETVRRSGGAAAATSGGSAEQSAAGQSSGGAVGSDAEAARHFADKNDFGVAAADAAKYPGLAAEAKSQPEGSHQNDPRSPRSDAGTGRTSGVGGRASGAGSSSGGDVDSDWVGVGSHGSGLSISGPDNRRAGADMTDGLSDPNAAAEPHASNIEPAHGAPADGRGIRPRDMAMHGDTVDHSGGDATTTGSGRGSGSVSSLPNGDDAEAGEISLGEAGGADNQ